MAADRSATQLDDRTPLRHAQHQFMAGLVGMLLRVGLYLPFLLIGLTYLFDRVLHPNGAGLRTDGIWFAIFETACLWALAGMVFRETALARNANSESFGGLEGIWSELDALQSEAQQLPGAGSLKLAARTLLESAWRDLHEGLRFDLRWVQASGYVQVWRTFGQIEATLIKIIRRELVVEIAIRDYYRLDDSNVPGRASLITSLKKALAVLSPTAAAALEGSDPPAKKTPPDPVHDFDDEGRDARNVLAEIHATISEYREDKYDGIVRHRNRSALATLLLGVVAFALLCAALLEGVGDQALDAAIVFFLVGGLVGLVGRVTADLSTDAEIQDYGLGTVRLLQAPLIAGLAALMAVVLFPLLYADSVQDALDLTKTSKVKLVDIFDLAKFPFGLVLAALFGLSPKALLDRLQQQAETYKKDLLATKASGGK